jgi:hypothetical protein
VTKDRWLDDSKLTLQSMTEALKALYRPARVNLPKGQFACSVTGKARTLDYADTGTTLDYADTGTWACSECGAELDGTALGPRPQPCREPDDWDPDLYL